MRAKKEKEGWPSITPGSAEQANKDVGRTVFTFTDSFQGERSSLPGRKDQLTETSQLWANLSPRQAALSCQPGPASQSPLSLVLQLPGVPQCHPQPWKRHAVGSPRELCYQTHHWGGHSLPQLTKATAGGWLYTLWPGVPTGPMAQPCSLPPQHSPAAQTAARYYSVVAWIPLNACQSAQRAESELFKLHLLKDPWCLFLLFVFSNSLKS